MTTAGGHQQSAADATAIRVIHLLASQGGHRHGAQGKNEAKSLTSRGEGRSRHRDIIPKGIGPGKFVRIDAFQNFS